MTQFLPSTLLSKVSRIVQHQQSNKRPHDLRTAAEMKARMVTLRQGIRDNTNRARLEVMWLDENKDQLSISEWFVGMFDKSEEERGIRYYDFEELYLMKEEDQKALIRRMTIYGGILGPEGIQRFNTGKDAYHRNKPLLQLFSRLQREIRGATELEYLVKASDDQTRERRDRPGTALARFADGGVLGIRKRAKEVAQFRQKRFKSMGGFGRGKVSRKVTANKFGQQRFWTQVAGSRSAWGRTSVEKYYKVYKMNSRK